MASNEELEIERRKLRLARIDPEQFGFFYEKYSGPIYRYAYFRTLDHDAAEDILSDTFALALDKLWKFQWQGVTFGAWLYRIALNLVTDHRRRLQRHLSLNEEFFDERAAQGPGPLAELLQDEDRSRLYACLSRLDETSIDIFVLHYWNELTVREIAIILKMKEGTIQSRLKRDREKLLAMLHKEGTEPLGSQTLSNSDAHDPLPIRKGRHDSL